MTPARALAPIAAALAVLAAGCAPKVAATSQPLVPVAEPRRVLVVAVLPDGWSLTRFPAAMEQELRACGVTAESFVRSQAQATLAINPGNDLRQAVARARPDIVLTAATSTARMHGASVENVAYRVTATTDGGKPVWKGDIKVDKNNAFTFGNAIYGEMLAREVILRLATDGILAHCPKPAG